MIDWSKGTWEKGDKAKYHVGRGERPEFEVFPGLYWYSGLGSGTFFRPDGTMLLNCTMQEASAEARKLGVEYRFVDSFVVSSFSSVMG